MVALAFFVACNSSDAPAENKAEAPAEKAKSAHSEAFNTGFADLLNAYYGLKDALVASDTARANAAVVFIDRSIDTVKLDELEAEVKTTAASFLGTIKGNAASLAAAKDIEAKRKEFQLISDAMYDLVRTVRYDGQKVYQQYCPMAFDNTGAAWLSKSDEILNPYFGDKMLHCGEVRDSLAF